MNLPALRNIGGDLNCAGNKEMNENSFPNLETIGGDIILSNSNFLRLPTNLKSIGGRAILSRQDNASLLDDLKRAKAEGILEGDIFYID